MGDKIKLTHWTNKEFREIMINGKGNFRPLPLDTKGGFKPIGFWVSVNNSWENWLKGNWETWLKGKVCLNVEFSKEINLFIIKSKKQFLEEFKKLTGRDYLKLGFGKYMLNDFHKKLKEQYDGVWLEAEPFYKHRLDLDFMYFYTWDCESICVWNKEKIKFIENGI